MTDLEKLRGAEIPREEGLAKGLARRVESIWGFVAYTEPCI